MLFDSPIYVVFLVLVVLAYWRLSHRTQNVFLLLASYFFYGWWDWRFLALMIGGTAVDVYKGKVEPSKSFLDYSLFISLFPHLIAGPIQRPGSLLPQIQKERSLDGDRFFDGLMLIFSGLIRKCVIADNCALLANAAFGGQLGPPNFWVVLIGVWAFAWQV